MAATSTAMRRMISASNDDDIDIDVVSQSSSSSQEDTRLSKYRCDTNSNPAFPPPMRAARFRTSSSSKKHNNNNDIPLLKYDDDDDDDDGGLYLSSDEPNRTYTNISSSFSFDGQSSSLPPLASPSSAPLLHHGADRFPSNHYNYNNDNHHNSVLTFLGARHNNVSREKQQPAYGETENYDIDDVDDDMTSETSELSSQNNNNNTFMTDAQRFALQSQPSNMSIRSGQSILSTQSWGQMAEIDVFPEANDMEAPTYVLEESPSSQNLWKQTAGNRPPQPIEERAFFERMWAENFARSQVPYGVSVADLVKNGTALGGGGGGGDSPMIVEDDGTASDHMYSSIYSIATPSIRSRKEDVAEAILVSRMNAAAAGLDSACPPSPPPYYNGSKALDKDTTLLWKGQNTFGTTVSKSFAQTGKDGLITVTTVNISIASYRVVESKRRGRYAQFHVIFREGSMRDTIGVWKRYRDFENLANKITDHCEGCSVLHGDHHVVEPEVEQLPNAVTSWRLMKKRKRWYRCLDAGYLSLKIFLLERFLHDVLFESSSPYLLRDFVMSSLVDESSLSLPNSP